VDLLRDFLTGLGPVLQPLLGGALIGLGAALLWLLDGRVAGVSGIASGVLEPAPGERSWRLAFLAGLLGGGALMWRLVPEAFGAMAVAARGGGLGGAGAKALAVAAVAGLLVGIGTSLSRGCTSGHGVCGISRLSRRSIAATMTFMATGDRKSTRLNSSHNPASRMPSSA
jgi:uncharacterized membrane protein YedE/YeeE